MKLEDALMRIGASVVKSQIAAEKATLFLRVSEERGALWVQALTAFLLGAQQKKTWAPDVSKYFFVSNGSIRYFWRIVITGPTEEALESFSRAALEAAMSNARELSSFPLVGRAEYTFDPARGLLKGAHELDKAAQYVAMHAVH